MCHLEGPGVMLGEGLSLRCFLVTGTEMTKGSVHYRFNTVLNSRRKLMAWLCHRTGETYDADNSTFNKRALDFLCVKLF